MGDDGVAYVELDLQWLWYVHAPMATTDHKFTTDWGRRMEEILILVGSIKVEGPSQETGQNNRTMVSQSRVHNGLG